MKHTTQSLIFFLVVGITLSACDFHSNGQSSTQTEVANSEPTKIATFSDPTPSVSQTLSATSIPILESHEETDPAILDIPYTKTNPLTSRDEIQEILDHLQNMEIAWFSRPGWYCFTIYLPSDHDYTRTRYVLTHVINENRDCREQFSYFEKDGTILPYSIHLDDGSFGLLYHTMDGGFQVINALPPEEVPPCDLGNRYSLALGTTDGNFILHNEAAQFRQSSNAIIEGKQTNYQAWVEDVDGKQTLILVYDITTEVPALRGGVLDPTTGILSPTEHTLRYYYIDLETGLQIQFNEEFFLETGSLVGNDDIDMLFSYEYFETMPVLIEDSYKDVGEALQRMLEESSNDYP